MLVLRFVQYGLPFDPRGEGRTAATAQAGGLYFIHNALRGQRCGFLQASKATVGDVIFNTNRVGNANSGKRKALLLLQVRVLRNVTQIQGVIGMALKQASSHQFFHLIRIHRAISDAAIRRLHFNQWLQPEQPA